jgi:hypothetical protein
MPPDTPAPKRSSFLSTVVILALTVLLIAGIYGLSLGTAGPALIIVAVVFALGALHYLIWGWWMGRMIRDDVEAEERESEERS